MIDANETSVRTSDGGVLCSKCAISKPASAQNRIARKTTGSFRRPSGAAAVPATPAAPLPAIETGSMKFYFCEICGKRITELDIQKGAGRDKKLKGVYCQNCAVGVTTMNELPVVVDPSPAAAAKSPAVAVRPRKSEEDAQRPAPKPFPLRMILMSGSGAVVLIVVAIFLSGKNGDHRSVAMTPGPVPIPAPQNHVAAITPHETEAPAQSKPDPAVIPPEVSSTVPVAPIDQGAPSPTESKPVETKPANLNPPDPQPAEAKPEEKEKESKPATTPLLPEPTTTAAAASAELVESILKPLKQHRFGDAEVIVRENKAIADATRQDLLAALSELQKDEQDFQDQIQRQTGKPVKFQTAKESVEGKLVSVDFPSLRIEKSIAINGEAIGSTVVSLNAHELNEVSRQSFYHPRDIDAAGWAGRTLSAMAGMRLNEAEAAIGHLNDGPLKAAIAAELKHQKIIDAEAQAQAAWTVIIAKAKEPPTQARAKQLIVDLATFEKNFGSTQFASNSPTSESLKELKEKMERMATGLDPRVMSLFKGRVVSYDAPSAVITLEYDFSTKAQTEDFSDLIWAPPGDATGLTWTKGKLATFGKDATDCLAQMPQFVSNTLNIQINYQNVRSSWGAAAFYCGFYSPKSTSKSPKVRVEWNKTGCSIIADSVLKTAPSNLKDSKEGKLELACRDKTISAKLNGTTLVEQALQKPNDHTGFWIGCGWDSGFTMTRLQVSGRLDPVWLANALKNAK